MKRILQSMDFTFASVRDGEQFGRLEMRVKEKPELIPDPDYDFEYSFEPRDLATDPFDDDTDDDLRLHLEANETAAAIMRAMQVEALMEANAALVGELAGLRKALAEAVRGR